MVSIGEMLGRNVASGASVSIGEEVVAVSDIPAVIASNVGRAT